MDFLQDIKAATIPWPLRAVLALLGVLILLLNCYILYVGFSQNKYDIWIASGGYLLGVVLPIIVVTLILQFSHSGVRALRDRTADVLTKLIPQQLRLTADCSEEARLPTQTKHKLSRSLTEVETIFLHGECWADYALLIPQMTSAKRMLSRIRLRIEINVRRANVDIFVPNAGSKLAQHRTFQDLFPHTLSGAVRAGYGVNDKPVTRVADGQNYDCLVLVREFENDFLWNAAEKLWFAQDLMFMVRSFVQEQPDLFANVERAAK